MLSFPESSCSPILSQGIWGKEDFPTSSPRWRSAPQHLWCASFLQSSWQCFCLPGCCSPTVLVAEGLICWSSWSGLFWLARAQYCSTDHLAHFSSSYHNKPHVSHLASCSDGPSQAKAEDLDTFHQLRPCGWECYLALKSPDCSVIPLSPACPTLQKGNEIFTFCVCLVVTKSCLEKLNSMPNLCLTTLCCHIKLWYGSALDRTGWLVVGLFT